MDPAAFADDPFFNFDDPDAYTFPSPEMPGVQVNCLGAWVIQDIGGRWTCEHGRGPHATDTVAALDCLKNCDYEGDAP